MSNHLNQELKDAIGRSMTRDRFRFNRELHSRSKRARLAERVAQSVALVDRRRRSVPRVIYPPQLPVSQRVDEIRQVIDDNQVVIIAGETGSGKTTQLPKICLELGRGVTGMIGHTQPRRVAARTVSHRIAEELAVVHGREVGYQVRFTDKTDDSTLIKIMTDGILLAETRADRFLEAYDTIIIDEAHERGLNVDFLLGYLKRILPKRPDLKVIVTSATIDVERFSRHFDNAPVLEVSGRTYPVEVQYRPLDEEGGSKDSDELMYQGVLDALAEIQALEQGKHRAGDVLVFLSGEREIRELSHEIRRSAVNGFDVLPLYSRLSVAEQNRVFQSHQGKRIVLATNVAETSLTVPGIRYVIDPGFARISRYSVRSKVQQLPIEPISQASAEQRKGRCGRISEGVCFRLYSEEDFASRPAFTAPEILRTNLGSVILQMLSLKLGDISRFPFVERPDQRQINDGFQLLKELRAVDDKRQVTRLGREMSRLPIDLKLARMLIEAGRSGCLSEVLTIVSVMSLQDPRERPHDHQQAADERHRQHWDERSDFLTLLNLWNSYESERQARTQNQLRRYCREQFLNYMRMREWKENHRQLHLLCRELGMRENRTPAEYASIHRALLSGLLGNIGERHEDNEYLGARNRRHFIFPGSSQFRRKPRWIMSAELVETTRLFGRTVAEIDNEWIEPLAGHLVKRNCFEPWFDAERGQVLANEEVMLYGLKIVKRRPVDFGAVDPVRARQMFIQVGLVEGKLQSKAPFYRHNARLIDEIEKLESKSRRRDLLIEPYRVFQFYDERLPPDILSEVDLEVWRRTAEAKKPKLLFLNREDLMQREADLSKALYPDAMDVADTKLRLDYHFDPQHAEDGVSVGVPVAMLRQVSEAQLDWLIPGLLREKCLALLRSLPKSVRKNFVPAPEFIDRVLPELEYDGRRLQAVLAERLFRLSGIRIDPDAFDPAGIARHLRMNIRVLDRDGRVIDTGRDLSELVRRHAGKVEAAFSARAGHTVEVERATDWDFGELPAQVEIEQSGIRLRGYPALVDKGEGISVEVVDNEFRARCLSEQGLLRLVLLNLKEPRKYLEKNFPMYSRFSVYHVTQGTAGELLSDLVDATFRYTFVEDKPQVRNRSAFEARLSEKQHLVTNANVVGELMLEILQARNALEKRLTDEQTELTRHACDDIRHQLDGLLSDRFLTRTPLQWLKHFPRYLAAIEYRLDRMQGNLGRDKAQTAEVQAFEARYAGLDGKAAADAQLFRWMIEELRVSLFAQPLGTSLPVSSKRLEKEWTSSGVRTGAGQS